MAIFPVFPRYMKTNKIKFIEIIEKRIHTSRKTLPFATIVQLQTKSKTTHIIAIYFLQMGNIFCNQ
jgi:hypothetical protein